MAKHWRQLIEDSLVSPRWKKFLVVMAECNKFNKIERSAAKVVKKIPLGPF